MFAGLAMPWFSPSPRDTLLDDLHRKVQQGNERIRRAAVANTEVNNKAVTSVLDGIERMENVRTVLAEATDQSRAKAEILEHESVILAEEALKIVAGLNHGAEP